MTDNEFIYSYLDGERPLHPHRLEIPADDVLDASEAEFDQLVAGAHVVPLWRRLMRAAAVVAVVLVVGAGLWQTVMHLNNQPSCIGEQPLPNMPIAEAAVAADSTARLVASTETEERPATPPRQAPARQRTRQTAKGPALTTAADSLDYYLTLLEQQVGKCTDEDCLAKMGELMQADERIRMLIERVAKQHVESAYMQIEVLVDSTDAETAL